MTAADSTPLGAYIIGPLLNLAATASHRENLQRESSQNENDNNTRN